MRVPTGLALDGQSVYWADSYPGAPPTHGTILRPNLDGTSPIKLISESSTVSYVGADGVAVDALGPNGNAPPAGAPPSAGAPPAGGSAPGSGSAPAGTGAPVPSGPSVGASDAGAVVAGQASVSGTSVSLPLSCQALTGTICAATMQLTVTESFKGSSLVAVSAAQSKRSRNRRRVLSLGYVSAALQAGQSRVIHISLKPRRQAAALSPPQASSVPRRDSSRRRHERGGPPPKGHLQSELAYAQTCVALRLGLRNFGPRAVARCRLGRRKASGACQVQCNASRVTLVSALLRVGLVDPRRLSTSGGTGRPLTKRSGLRAKPASSTRARASCSCCAWPRWMAAGVTRAISECRCWRCTSQRNSSPDSQCSSASSTSPSPRSTTPKTQHRNPDPNFRTQSRGK